MCVLLQSDFIDAALQTKQNISSVKLTIIIIFLAHDCVFSVVHPFLFCSVFAPMVVRFHVNHSKCDAQIGTEQKAERADEIKTVPFICGI